MKILFLSSILTINSFCQCIGTGCPGGSGGTVSSVFSRTGAVVATGGDYAANLGAYNCSATTSDGENYTCSTGFSLSTRPADGSVFYVTFLQVCTVANVNLTIDSLTSKLISGTDGTNMKLGFCQANAIGLVRLAWAGGSFTLTNILAMPAVQSCSSSSGSLIYYTAGQKQACAASGASFDSANFRLQVAKLSGQTGFTPSIAAGLAAGTSPTVSMSTNSTDLSGRINVTTGTAPTTGVLAVITFSFAYSTAPFCTLTPANAATALLSGTTMVYPSTAVDAFGITSGSVALVLSTAYSWYYTCVQ